MKKLEILKLKNNYHKVIPRMFAAAGEMYADYWNDFFHFAIFEDEAWDFDQAFAYTHEYYMDAARIREAEKILVLACGRGGFAHIIAQNTRGQVLGIDISPAQLKQARRFYRDNLVFRQHDIMKIDELGQTFDAIIFLDAACYLPNKKKALKKIGKLMKPGARLLMLDWCKQKDLNFIQEELALEPFMKYWAISGLETIDSYRSYFKEFKYQIHKVEDLNKKTRKNWDYSYENGLKGLRELSLKDLPQMLMKGSKAGPAAVRIMKEQFPALLYIKAAFDLGFLRYVYFLVER